MTTCYIEETNILLKWKLQKDLSYNDKRQTFETYVRKIQDAKNEIYEYFKKLDLIMEFWKTVDPYPNTNVFKYKKKLNLELYWDKIVEYRLLDNIFKVLVKFNWTWEINEEYIYNLNKKIIPILWYDFRISRIF